MNAVEFDADNPCPVYILRGGDAYLKDVVIKKLKGVIPVDLVDMNYLRYEEDASVSEIVSNADAFSFSGEKKVVVYRPPKSGKISDDDKNRLAEYVKNPCETTVLVLDDDNSVLKFLDKYAEIVSAASPGEAFVVRWVNNLFLRDGFSIERQAAETLVRHCNFDMMRIGVESEKLKNYAETKNIRALDVAECVAPDTEMQVFELTNYLAKKDNKNSLRIYNILLNRGESPAFLLSVIVSQFRRIMHAMLSDLSDAELSAVFKVKEYPITAARRLSANFTKLRVKKIVDKLIECEYLFKSGAVNEKAALELSFAYMLAV
ncbi:MAG: DNA polymerase III subunit delta [Clostridiales bacterium]|jgi:DNA polymerase III delta subunit|nr:DNA polymerase III subunit delta [Clostridiales bacterium]